MKGLTMVTQHQFTRLEREILLHRLAAADGIADVYRDTCQEHGSEAERQAAYDLALNETTRLWERITAGTAVEPRNSLERWILAEAVNGSTWIGCLSGNESEQVIGRQIAAGQRLAEKIRALTGEPCEFPTG